jgi:hypothetical protein
MESSPPASLPTPTSENNDSSRGQKRKRVVVTVPEGDEETDKFNKYFDPNQDPDVRRDVKRRSRALEREFQENRDELLRSRGGEGLINTIDNANAVFKEVKQTNDATLDSRLLVNISDLAYKKSAQLVLGDTSTGIDVELFLSKCITFMRNGSSTDDNPTSTQRRRNAMRHDEDDDDDGDDDENANGALDWELLGQHACFPFNSRPAAPSFLLGPLSVEKKQRAQTQRRGRQAKDNAGQEARPDQLSREDLTQSNENQLTSICARIHTQLRKHCKRGARSVEQAGLTTLESREAKALLRENRITATGGPSLFEYVINPDSFGQTVENLFYVSFLIKEGSIGITADDDGLPTLSKSFRVHASEPRFDCDDSNVLCRSDRATRYRDAATRKDE